jgi:hypothetical protein
MIEMRSTRSPHYASAQIMWLPMYPAPPGELCGHKAFQRTILREALPSHKQPKFRSNIVMAPL